MGRSVWLGVVRRPASVPRDTYRMAGAVWQCHTQTFTEGKTMVVMTMVVITATMNSDHDNGRHDNGRHESEQRKTS